MIELLQSPPYIEACLRPSRALTALANPCPLVPGILAGGAFTSCAGCRAFRRRLVEVPARDATVRLSGDFVHTFGRQRSRSTRGPRCRKARVERPIFHMMRSTLGICRRQKVVRPPQVVLHRGSEATVSMLHQPRGYGCLNSPKDFISPQGSSIRLRTLKLNIWPRTWTSFAESQVRLTFSATSDVLMRFRSPRTE